MRKRSEITTRPDRTFFWNDGMDAPVEHFAKQLDDFATDATHTESQDVRAQRECADARSKKHERLHLRERPPQVQRGKSAHPSTPFTQLNGKRMRWEARHLIRMSLYRRVTG